METPKDWQKEVFERYPSLHKAITGTKMNIFGTKNSQNDLVKLLNIKSQLQADKAELLEALQDIQDELENGDTPKVYKIEEIIEKHKQ